MCRVLTSDGSINKNGGKWEGKKRFDCRVEMVKALTEMGLFRGKKPNPGMPTLLEYPNAAPQNLSPWSTPD